MEFLEEKGRIYAVDANGKLLAEVTFPDDGNTAVIDHTFVDESLRGQGTASKLLRPASRQKSTAGMLLCRGMV